jgi:hypothetical protein
MAMIATSNWFPAGQHHPLLVSHCACAAWTDAPVRTPFNRSGAHFHFLLFSATDASKHLLREILPLFTLQNYFCILVEIRWSGSPHSLWAVIPWNPGSSSTHPPNKVTGRFGKKRAVCAGAPAEKGLDPLPICSLCRLSIRGRKSEIGLGKSSAQLKPRLLGTK